MENILFLRFRKDSYGSVLLLLMMALTVISCSKSDDIPESIIPDVYVAGYIINPRPEYHAVLWKNYEATLLNEGGGDESAAWDVFVSGKDVYVAGYIKYGNFRMPTLWKNGTNITLSDKGGEATAVFVSGKDVYVSGDTRTLWKNGVEYSLPIEGSLGRANDVFVKGNDVYVCGWSNWDESYPSNLYLKRAVHWKNGEFIELSDGSRAAEATALYVSGNDVYTVGARGDEYHYYYATLWKNGSAQYLSSKKVFGRPEAYGVFVSGNDVYAVGYDYTGTDTGTEIVPMLWKNGTATVLPKEGHDAGIVFDIYVKDGKAYMCGTLGSRPILWIDNEFKLLSDKGGYANAVFVTKRN